MPPLALIAGVDVVLTPTCPRVAALVAGHEATDAAAAAWSRETLRLHPTRQPVRFLRSSRYRSIGSSVRCRSARTASSSSRAATTRLLATASVG